MEQLDCRLRGVRVLHSVVDDTHVQYRQQNIKFSGYAFRLIVILGGF